MRRVLRASGAVCATLALVPDELNPPPAAPPPSKLITALVAYSVIALLAAFTLTGKFRIVVWIFMAAFAIKSWLHTRRPPED